ncbi:MAG: flagellar hook-associated protein FlgK [Phycisphaerae bacterium]|jgi:flagellar hook-associated protein 1 FlgK
MGLLNSALQVGRSALLSYEGALHVVGNNISGAGSPDFTRLSPQLDPLRGTTIVGDLQPGGGVALNDIQRNIDEALEGRVRSAIGVEASLMTQNSAIAQVEAMFDDLSGNGLGVRLTDFFHAFDQLQSTPEDTAIRDLVVTEGALLATSIRDLRTRLTDLGNDIDAQIAAAVAEADRIARDIGKLNTDITTAEAQNQGPAAGLRDQRDALLRELSEIFDVIVREQPNGTINVYVGSEALVQGNSVRGLVAVEEVEGETTRTSVRFADTNQQIDVGGGRLHGLLVSRDRHRQVDALDQLASALIDEVNRVHADGQGLAGFTSVIGTNEVLATDAALDSNAAGLAFPPSRGSFYITVSDDATNTPVAYRVDVPVDGTDSGMTLDALIARINTEVDGVTASITGDNRLRFDADEGYTFVFGYDGQVAREDTSRVLSALGVNTFFTGTDARNIEVNDVIRESSSLLAAATVSLSGDGTNAGRMAALDSTISNRLDNASITGFYKTLANAVAVTAAAVREEHAAASSVHTSLLTQRESISGVNLDEEAISLVKYQRAFQGAARFVSAVDELIGELVLLVR